MQLTKINEGLLYMINCHQTEKNSQKGHKTTLNSVLSIPNSIMWNSDLIST